MSPSFDPQVAGILQALTTRIEEDIPELGAILKDARSRGGSEAEVMQQALAALASNPTLAKRFEAISFEIMAPLREEKTPADIVVKSSREGGLPRLHPNYEASLAERVSFDGDAPELRFKALPKGGIPAVPVHTEARNPATLGWMLERASEEVVQEIQQIEKTRIAEVAGSTALETQGQTALEQLDRDNLPEPEGYKRGQIPALREVAEPEGRHLATLTAEQQRQLAWKFLSTTQGRRSATRVIRDLIYTNLRADGYSIVLGGEEPQRVSSPEKVLVHVSWAVALAGPRATQSSFAFVDTAAQVLTHKIEAELDVVAGSGAVLEVIPLNTVEIRKVGWAARLVRSSV